MKKIAILIGNNSYPGSGRLENAINDAEKLSEKLEELGFKCISVLDAKVDEIDRKMKEFKEIVNEYEVGLFFFAGHGVQIDGENYLLAIDTNIQDESSCKYSSMPLNQIIDTFEKSKIITTVIILDACRNNPFSRGWRGYANRGLAPVSAPKGTIISYATSPGQVACDGIGDNGAFTSSLLNHIGTPGLGIEEMFKRVRNTLSSISDNKQISWEHTSLMGEFWFNPAFLNNEFLTSYSKEALSDKDYIFNTDSVLSDIIGGLKSHDWYIQNPAINKINSIEFHPNTKKDEIFLLGRNIYQAACGDSIDAGKWISDLDYSLKKLDPETSFNILNGILYEIYFDSKGKLRKKFKTRYFEPVIKILNNPEYEKSCTFIRNQLEQYTQRVIYTPGTDQIIYLDVIVNINDENQYYIEKVCLEGQNVFYDEDGINLYDYDSYYYSIREYDLGTIEEMIREALVVPRGYVRINYVNNGENEYLLFPYEFMLLRFPF